MRPPRQAVMLCGGRGARLRPLTDATPKPMIPVDGRPFLEHLLRQLADQGIQRFLLLTGYLGDQIRDYFGDGGPWGWQVTYYQGPVEWDTGRRIWEARQQLESRFLLLYSDNFVQFSLDRLMALHRAQQASLSLLLAPKANGNVRVSASGRIAGYDPSRSPGGMDFVEVGYMVAERDRLLQDGSALPSHPDSNLSEWLQRLAGNRQLAGLVVRDPYHSISDPDRLALMRRYLQPKKILLIDRDGVINQKAARGDYVRTWEQFRWIPETRRAMKDLSRRGFEFIVISNQAGVARGMIDPAALEQIHQNMVGELRQDGVQVLGVYVCPHHWDERCDCRKPAPGLFYRASRDHLLRMDRTIYIGDDPRDSQAAQNSGCRSVLVGGGRAAAARTRAQGSLQAGTLLQAIPWICAQFRDWDGCAGAQNASATHQTATP